MDSYVQFPLSASALRKWMRFAAKGGIGSAVGLTDKLAQPESNELMFMDGEDLIVLMHLDKQVYLGCCEGVVGIFHEQDVRFTTKLKKPVFTKSASSTPSANGAAAIKVDLPSEDPAHKRSSSAGSAIRYNGLRKGTANRSSDARTPELIQGTSGHLDTLGAPAVKRRSRSWSPVRDSPQHNLDRLLSQASLYQDDCPPNGNDSTQSSLDRDALTPEREELDYPLTPLNQTGERWFNDAEIDSTPMAVEAQNGDTPDAAFADPTAGLTKRQTRRLGMASPLTSPVGTAFNVGAAKQVHTIASGWPVMDDKDVEDKREQMESLVDPVRHSMDSADTPATDTEQFILDSYEYSALSPTKDSGNSIDTHQSIPAIPDDSLPYSYPDVSQPIPSSTAMSPRDHDISLSGGSVASLIRRRMESNSRSPYSETSPLPLLDAPLQIQTGMSPASQRSDRGEPSQASDPESSPSLSLKSPTGAIMPNLPQGVSLKQLRASPGSSFSFPRRSPHGNNIKAPPTRRRAASGPSPVVDAASSSNSTLVSLDSGHKASDRLQSVALSKTLSQPVSPASSNNQVRLESPAAFAYRIPPKPPQTSFRTPPSGTSSPSASSFHSEQQYSPGLGSDKNGGLSFPSSAANSRPRAPNSPLHKARPLHNGQANHVIHGGQVGPASPTDYFGTVLSPVASTSSHASDRSPTKMRHSRSFSGLSGLTRASSVLNRRRPSLPNGSTHVDNRKEPSIDSQRDAVVHLGNTEFEFVQPTLPKASLGDSLGAGSLLTLNNTLAESTLESPIERSHSDRFGTPSLDYETHAEGGSGLLHSTLVTRPSEAAKARVRSIYIEDQYVEPSYLAARFAPAHTIQEDEGDPSSISTRLSEDQTGTPDARALEAHRARELKWVQVMNQMSAPSAKKSKKVKRLVSYGIPSSVRGKAWTFLAEVDTYRRQNVYHDLCGRDTPSYQAELERDLDQAFANQPHFNGENGLARHDLLSIMRAFAYYAPEIGYHRGLCSIAGILLLHVEAETAFWLLVSIVKTHLVGYYTPGMRGFRVDAFVLNRLLRSSEPKLHQAFETAGIDPEAFASAWFLPLFVNTLPWPSLLRIVDSLLYSDQSSKFILRVGLSILDLLRDPLLSAGGNILPMLLNPPQELLNPPSLLPTVFTVKVPERTLRKYTKLAETSLDIPLAKSGRQRPGKR